jgi:pyruvate/2-oxoglutarate dehydrogenase complex dihydrolipoamide acyltransferase (E2) component
MSGVETGTPLVTLPQAAIVFVGAILNRPVAIGNSLEVRPTFYVSIGYDHRVVDGATAAKFTSTLKQKLETP